jgi:hypothetical protein
MDYVVINSTHLGDLIEEVKYYLSINEGWKPIGGICVAECGFYQAMIKE